MAVTMQSGKIVQWLKKEDDLVSKGEVLAIVEGEKTTFEIECPESGVLRKITHAEGSDVPVGEVIALVTSPGEDISNFLSS
jgi:pyruvate/2-oxoglutarate dehydrogenase complex dihydrolipoamide acyltransferase (E2) component